jgi:bisphosphoglycerate-independent phosphoglycerate mutase (AlkP superfamily)
MPAGLRVGASAVTLLFTPAHGRADDDTLFLFNYRSDRMREISTVLGHLDKPVDVEIPKDLASLPCICSLSFRNLSTLTAHYHHVSL